MNGPTPDRIGKLSHDKIEVSGGDTFKPRITLVIATPAFAVTYLRDSILSQLTKSYIVTLVVESSIDLTKCETKDISQIFTFRASQSDEISYAFFHQVLAWRLRKKSRSFKLRIEREQPSLLVLITETIRRLFHVLSDKNGTSILGESNSSESRMSRIVSVFKIITLLIIDAFRYPWRKLKIRFCALQLIHASFVKYFKPRLKLNQELLNILKESKPKLLIYPNIGFGALSIQVAYTCRQLNIPSLYLLDNWDNISSKSIMWEKPNYINVFGPQSAQHAIEIQGFAEHQIFSCGTPRFDGYLRIEKKAATNYKISDSEIPYILFTDTMHSYNINSFLKILSEEVYLFRQDTGRKLKVIYRPHPRPDLEVHLRKIKKHPYVEIDGETLARLQDTRRAEWKYRIPDDEYLPKLVKDSEFLTGGLTSMLLEAAMLGKRYVGIAHNEWFSRDNPRKLLLNYTHLQDIERLSHITVCRNKNIFRKCVRTFINGDSILMDDKTLSDQLSFFYTKSHPSYPIALGGLIREIIA